MRIIVILVLCALVYLAFGPSSDNFSWRQKVTVTVDTPNGEVSGASVMQVDWDSGISWIKGDASGSGFTLTGEAPVVELGNGRYLFALLNGMDSKLLYQLGRKDGRGPSMRENRKAITGMKGKLALPMRASPLLVTFGDITDPASVKRVDPNDLDAAFGCGHVAGPTPWRDENMTWVDWQRFKASGLTRADFEKQKQRGFTSQLRDIFKTLPEIRDISNDCYRLSSITLEITDEPVTKGEVEKVLGWLGDGNTLTQIWSELSSQQHDLLSSVNWKKE